MAQKFLALDVGGTQIKSCLVDNSGALCSDIVVKDANAYDSLPQILENFSDRIKAYDRAALSGIGFGFPGPFDYENGISLMKGIGVRESKIGKYDAMYGFAFGDWVKEQFSLPVRFCNDADLFGLGSYRFTLGGKHKRVLSICIGTGFGGCVIENGAKVAPLPGISESGWLYEVPFLDGIADSYLSATGLERLIRQNGHPARDGKALYDAALAGDAAAKDIFLQFGEQFAQFVTDMENRLHPDALVIGGQVAKSFDLWGVPLRKRMTLPAEHLYLDCDSTQTAMRAVSLLFEK